MRARGGSSRVRSREVSGEAVKGWGAEMRVRSAGVVVGKCMFCQYGVGMELARCESCVREVVCCGGVRMWRWWGWRRW